MRKHTHYQTRGIVVVCVFNYGAGIALLFEPFLPRLHELHRGIRQNTRVLPVHVFRHPLLPHISVFDWSNARSSGTFDHTSPAG